MSLCAWTSLWDIDFDIVRCWRRAVGCLGIWDRPMGKGQYENRCLRVIESEKRIGRRLYRRSVTCGNMNEECLGGGNDGRYRNNANNRIQIRKVGR